MCRQGQLPGNAAAQQHLLQVLQGELSWRTFFAVFHDVQRCTKKNEKETSPVHKMVWSLDAARVVLFGEIGHFVSWMASCWVACYLDWLNIALLNRSSMVNPLTPVKPLFSLLESSWIHFCIPIGVYSSSQQSKGIHNILVTCLVCYQSSLYTIGEFLVGPGCTQGMRLCSSLFLFLG